jgi:cardiolipin synthase
MWVRTIRSGRRYADWVINQVWTVPNALSFLRLLGIPLFLWLLLVQQLDVLAFLVLVVAGASDWLDGYLARKLDQRTALGALLDPLVDRLYIAATLIGLALRDFIPWWIVGIIVLRELMLLVIWPRIRRQGVLALPVTLVGKAGTFALLWGFPCLLLSGQSEPLGSLAIALGWAFAIWGIWLYWWAGVAYVRTAFRVVG